MEKYCRAGQATDDNMAHAHCMLDNLRLQIHFRLCNTHCFSTSTVVTRLHECASVLRYTYIACFFFLHSWRLLATWWKCELDWSCVVLNYFLSAPPLRIKKNTHFLSRAHLWRKFLRDTKAVDVRVSVYLKELCTHFHRDYLDAWARTPWKRIKCTKIKLLH